MKRYNGIYHKIYSLDNLRKAHHNARRGKGHYRDVKKINKNEDFYLKKLQFMLMNKVYKTSPYKVFTKIDKGKEREICKLPYFPDRICQWAILQQIQPILMKTLISTTYASIPERGIHQALRNVRDAVYSDTSKVLYCFKFDIKKFYPSIKHDILKGLLIHKFKDKDLLSLLFEIIDSTKTGIPIGNYLSQWLSNFYLSYFDHYVKNVLKVKNYFRYMDDIILLSDDKDFLFRCKDKIEVYLDKKLCLRVKENWQIYPVHKRGIDFVGYRVFKKYTLLRKRILKAMKRMILKRWTFESLMSYYGWLLHCNSYNLRSVYL